MVGIITIISTLLGIFGAIVTIVEFGKLVIEAIRYIKRKIRQ